ncbi:unnamed protein product [Mytilus edulis]|uniref:Sacsin/Nov domain-containing protein n=1 Tax=Mytilus edulis TaxID=6550 RepID=A0A8S3VHS3_MYTED|nr:unnamed protein product [Mytilus edulis]
MDILMLYAIDNASDEMCNLLKEHKCIPTAPNRVLRHPSELVDRKGLLNSLFKEEDERFVILDLNTYSKPTRLTTLARLGMTTSKLSENLLIDRAKSIQNLASTCALCIRSMCTERKYTFAKWNICQTLPSGYTDSRRLQSDFYGLNAAYSLKSMKGFLKLLQIDDRCSAAQVLSKLEMYKSKYGLKEMNEDEVKLYVRLLKVLVSSMKFDNWEAASNVCLDESTVNSTETMHFTHDSISNEIAMALGINTKRKHKVEECSKDLYSQDFGQHEELLTRIKRILDGYPFDVCILKELLQNADDAKASEVHIVVDFNNHPTDDLFGEMKQGDDPTKTGQYGVGFNAVYHLTDVPSFLSRGQHVETGEVLCVFDPHCHYVSKASGRNPGRKYVNTKTLKEDHPNVFSCYHENLLMGTQGTIFRLPLRTEIFTKKSQISNRAVTEVAVHKLLQEFKRK